MDVHINDVARVTFAFVVTLSLPVTTNARIALDRTAVHLAERRAKLATVRDVIHFQASARHSRENGRPDVDATSIDNSEVQLAAAGDTAGAWHRALDDSLTRNRGHRD